VVNETVAFDERVIVGLDLNPRMSPGTKAIQYAVDGTAFIVEWGQDCNLHKSNLLA
jgi:hypothetical protein